MIIALIVVGVLLLFFATGIKLFHKQQNMLLKDLENTAKLGVQEFTT